MINLTSLSDDTINEVLDVIHNKSKQCEISKVDDKLWMLDFVYDLTLQRKLFDFVDNKYGENKLVDYANN